MIRRCAGGDENVSVAFVLPPAPPLRTPELPQLRPPLAPRRSTMTLLAPPRASSWSPPVYEYVNASERPNQSKSHGKSAMRRSAEAPTTEVAMAKTWPPAQLSEHGARLFHDDTIARDDEMGHTNTSNLRGSIFNTAAGRVRSVENRDDSEVGLRKVRSDWRRISTVRRVALVRVCARCVIRDVVCARCVIRDVATWKINRCRKVNRKVTNVEVRTPLPVLSPVDFPHCEAHSSSTITVSS